jgi:pimeloyl-ACP methyl ester carboxylesterase
MNFFVTIDSNGISVVRELVASQNDVSRPVDTERKVMVAEELVVFEVLQCLRDVTAQVVGHPYPIHAMNDVALELAGRNHHRIKVLVLVGQISTHQQLKPKAQGFGSGYYISDPRVVSVRDPEGTGSHVRFLAVTTHVRNDDLWFDSAYANVSHKLIARLDAIFQHVTVSFGEIGYIFLNKEVVGTVDDNAALVGIANGILDYYRA